MTNINNNNNNNVTTQLDSIPVAITAPAQSNNTSPKQVQQQENEYLQAVDSLLKLHERNAPQPQSNTVTLPSISTLTTPPRFHPFEPTSTASATRTNNKSVLPSVRSLGLPRLPVPSTTSSNEANPVRFNLPQMPSMRMPSIAHMPSMPQMTVSSLPSITTSPNMHAMGHMQQNVQSRRRSFDCQFCPRSFHRTEELQRHLVTAHNQVIFSCDLCQSSFTTRRGLKYHLLRTEKYGKCRTTRGPIPRAMKQELEEREKRMSGSQQDSQDGESMRSESEQPEETVETESKP